MLVEDGEDEMIWFWRELGVGEQRANRRMGGESSRRSTASTAKSAHRLYNAVGILTVPLDHVTVLTRSIPVVGASTARSSEVSAEAPSRLLKTHPSQVISFPPKSVLGTMA